MNSHVYLSDQLSSLHMASVLEFTGKGHRILEAGHNIVYFPVIVEVVTLDCSMPIFSRRLKNHGCSLVFNKCTGSLN